MKLSEVAVLGHVHLNYTLSVRQRSSVSGQYSAKHFEEEQIPSL